MNGHAIETEFKKGTHILLQRYKDTSNVMLEFLSASTFQLLRHHNTSLSPEWKAFNLQLRTLHTVYLKHFDRIDSIRDIYKNDINKITSLTIDRIEILPNYEKFEIAESTIRPVLTYWEEINEGQRKLFEQLSLSSDSFDLQNVGNIARTIMLKLSELVYVHEKHKPDLDTISVNPDKFKNRLTSYIIKELAGEKNKELRHLAEASIASVEKSIDLANAVTHKTDVDRTFAEVCVIGTIGAISIIKLIHKQSTTQTNEG